MKFLVDAQLPIRLARLLQMSGYDVIHTRDLPGQNATTDSEIIETSFCSSLAPVGLTEGYRVGAAKRKYLVVSS